MIEHQHCTYCSKCEMRLDLCKCGKEAQIMYKIHEEVPGVPEDERWFVTGPEIEYPYPKFCMKESAVAACKSNGWEPFDVERFEP